MSAKRIAVIDLGSNTFHLLIAEWDSTGAWSAVWKERDYVKLASGGLHLIDDDSIARAIDTMVRFSERLRAYGVTDTRAMGTAALREAANGQEVAARIRDASGIAVEIIDGQDEAGYILEGIRSCIPPFSRPGLIMDIGGGSVEFILYSGETLLFKGSYKIGVAVLFRTFHHADPIANHEIEALEQHIAEVLAPLLQAVRAHGPYTLIGASGSFEVIQDVIPKTDAGNHWSALSLEGILPYLDEIIGMNADDRRQVPEIPVERIDYIVVAYLLIRYILREIPAEGLFYCDFALKEGVLAEMIKTKINNLD